MNKIKTYEEAARSIYVNLKDFCDESKTYPDMIADAARKISNSYERLEKKYLRVVEHRDYLLDLCVKNKMI